MSSTKFLLATLFTFSITIPASAQNPTILQSFPSSSGPGYKPCPDTTGAVGPNHVVSFPDSSFMVHDKSTGKILVQLSMIDFWKSVEPKNTLILTTPNTRA